MPLPLSLERITGRETLLVRAPSCVSLSLADQDRHPGEFISLLRFLAKLCRVETAMRSEKTDPQPNSLSPARGYPQAKVRAPKKGSHRISEVPTSALSKEEIMVTIPHTIRQHSAHASIPL